MKIKPLGAAGAAIIEFALILPLMLMLLFAGLEFTRLYITFQRVDRAGNQIANVATLSGSVSCQNLRRFAEQMVDLVPGYDDSNGKVIFSLVERSSAAMPRVVDQIEFGGFGPTSRVGSEGGAAALGSCVATQPLLRSCGVVESALVVEVMHAYQPLLGGLSDYLDDVFSSGAFDLPDGDDPDDVLYKRTVHVSRAGTFPDGRFRGPGC